MEYLGYRVLTAQNGPEMLSIESRRRPAERAAKLRAVRAGK
jgi:hypothetical protein